MSDDALQQLGKQAQAMLSAMSPSERRKVAIDIARTLRASQAKRIRANIQPDGSPMAPRKAQPPLRGRKGALRRKMFAKLVQPRWFKASASVSEATVEYSGSAKRIAAIHHFGLRERIKMYDIRYPTRQLLGITELDIDKIENTLIIKLSK